MSYLARRAWIEVAYAATRVGYWIKPYDMLADRRRWFFQRRQRCLSFMLPPGPRPESGPRR